MVRVGPYEFDHVSYDEHGDVLYLRRGPRGSVADTIGSPQGHGIQLDAYGEVVGVTVVNAKWLREQNGRLALTLPVHLDVDPCDLEVALGAG